jgi:hypothetical protein
VLDARDLCGAGLFIVTSKVAKITNKGLGDG